MSKATTDPACLASELLHEAALARPLPAEAARHLETCAHCQAAVADLRANLQQARSEFGESIERAVTQFRMPALPQRQPRRSGLWSFVATPIPAYAAAAALMLLLLPLMMLRPPLPGQPQGLTRPQGSGLPQGLEFGGEKGLGPELSAEGAFAEIYAPDPQDAAALRRSYDVIGQYSAQHPEDLAAHVKLAAVCEALLKLRGWERPDLTREAVKERWAEERAAVERGLPRPPAGGVR